MTQTLAELTAEFERRLHAAELFSDIGMKAHLETVSDDQLLELEKRAELILMNMNLFADERDEYDRLCLCLEFINRQIAHIKQRARRKARRP
jgi:hypothetical protein